MPMRTAGGGLIVRLEGYPLGLLVGAKSLEKSLYHPFEPGLSRPGAWVCNWIGFAQIDEQPLECSMCGCSVLVGQIKIGTGIALCQGCFQRLRNALD